MPARVPTSAPAVCMTVCKCLCMYIFVGVIVNTWLTGQNTLTILVTYLHAHMYPRVCLLWCFHIVNIYIYVSYLYVYVISPYDSCIRIYVSIRSTYMIRNHCLLSTCMSLCCTYTWMPCIYICVSYILVCLEPTSMSYLSDYIYLILRLLHLHLSNTTSTSLHSIHLHLSNTTSTTSTSI
jgi:hypothetical protein